MLANGITGTYDGNNADILRAMTAFSAIALYNSVELIVLVLCIFKKYTGLYFWSLLITSISIIPYTIGAWLKQINLSVNVFVAAALSTTGWMVMIPAQSLVLYSRLHLVTHNRRLLRAVLWLIIVNTIVLCIPTAALTYGAQSVDKNAFVNGYAIMEKIQMTVFTVQEITISIIYLWEVWHILQVVCDGETRNTMWQLGALNIVIIIMDVALVTVEFFNLYEIETTLKGLVYSIKLKLEFGILSKLVQVVTSKGSTFRNPSYDANANFASNAGIDTARMPDVVFSLSRFESARKSSMRPLTGAEFTNLSLESDQLVTNSLEEYNWSSGSQLVQAPMTSDPIDRPKFMDRCPSISEMYPGKLEPNKTEPGIT